MKYYEDPISRLARLAAVASFLIVTVVSAIRGDAGMFCVGFLFLWVVFDDSGWVASDEDSARYDAVDRELDAKGQ